MKFQTIFILDTNKHVSGKYFGTIFVRFYYTYSIPNFYFSPNLSPLKGQNFVLLGHRHFAYFFPEFVNAFLRNNSLWLVFI